MKTETIQQRIESTEKQIEKKQKSIQRYQAFIDKVNKQLLDKKGFYFDLFTSQYK